MAALLQVGPTFVALPLSLRRMCRLKHILVGQLLPNTYLEAYEYPSSILRAAYYALPAPNLMLRAGHNRHQQHLQRKVVVFIVIFDISLCIAEIATCRRHFWIHLLTAHPTHCVELKKENWRANALIT